MDFFPLLRYCTDMTPSARCIRCGTCCKKGGPALHVQDKPLIDSGRIPLAHLFTIRRGEPAYDNVKNRLTVCLDDIIKIKNLETSTDCFFYDAKTKRCRIYRDRPLECRVLNCRDTKGIETLYAQNRISRRTVLKDVEKIWEIVEDHQCRCDYRPVLAFVQNLNASGGKKSSLEQKAVYAIQYDLEIRKLLIEKRLVDPAIMDFLLGRPSVHVVRAMGFNMLDINGKIVFRAESDAIFHAF
jgi:Fe-S-cluster containining protein